MGRADSAQEALREVFFSGLALALNLALWPFLPLLPRPFAPLHLNLFVTIVSWFCHLPV